MPSWYCAPWNTFLQRFGALSFRKRFSATRSNHQMIVVAFSTFLKRFAAEVRRRTAANGFDDVGGAQVQPMLLRKRIVGDHPRPIAIEAFARVRKTHRVRSMKRPAGSFRIRAGLGRRDLLDVREHARLLFERDRIDDVAQLVIPAALLRARGPDLRHRPPTSPTPRRRSCHAAHTARAPSNRGARSPSFPSIPGAHFPRPARPSCHRQGRQSARGARPSTTRGRPSDRSRRPTRTPTPSSTDHGSSTWRIASASHA